MLGNSCISGAAESTLFLRTDEETLNRIRGFKVSSVEALSFMANCTPVMICITEFFDEIDNTDVEFKYCNEAFAHEHSVPASALQGKRLVRDFKEPRGLTEISLFAKYREAKLIGKLKVCTLKYLGSNLYVSSIFDASKLLLQEIDRKDRENVVISYEQPDALEISPQPKHLHHHLRPANLQQHAQVQPQFANLQPADDDNPIEQLPPCIQSFSVAGPSSQTQAASSSCSSCPKKAELVKEPWRVQSLRILADDLERSENRFKLLEEAQIMGIGTADSTGRILSGNTRFFQMLKWKPEDYLKGKYLWTDFRDEQTIIADDKAIAELIKTGRTLPFERTTVSADGQETHNLFSLISLDPERSQDPNNLFLVFVVDLNAQKMAHKAIEKAKDDAMKASAMKSQFLSSMSHEIRTPLAATISLLELMKDSSDSARFKVPIGTAASPIIPAMQGELLGTALRSSRSLLTLLNDVLDTSKLEAGRLEFHNVEFDIEELVDDALVIIAEIAQNKGIEIDLKFDEEIIGQDEHGDFKEIPQIVFGDPTRLRQCLINLISNAIKFSHSCGTIVVQVNAVQEELQSPDKVKLRFSVTDYGIGIHEEDIKKLFQPFVQVDSSVARKFEGCGLGLVISKKLVEMMNGSIEVTSTLGTGTTFSFTAQFGVIKPSTRHLPICSAKEAENVDVYVLSLPSNANNQDVMDSEEEACAAASGSDSDSDHEKEDDEEEDDEGEEGSKHRKIQTKAKREKLQEMERKQHLLFLIDRLGLRQPASLDSVSEITLITNDAFSRASASLKKSMSPLILSAPSCPRNLVFTLDIPTCCASSAIRKTQLLMDKILSPPLLEKPQFKADLDQENECLLNVSVVVVCSTVAQYKISQYFAEKMESKSSEEGEILYCSKSMKLAQFDYNVELFFVSKPLRQARLRKVLGFAIQEAHRSSIQQCEKVSSRRSSEARIDAGIILVAEDNSVMSKILSMQLSKLHKRHTMVADGKQLVDAFEAAVRNGQHVAAVITDQMMPNMGGSEAAMKIREIESKNDQEKIPIICLTADVHAAATSHEAGINECLTKPVSIKELECTLKKWIS